MLLVSNKCISLIIHFTAAAWTSQTIHTPIKYLHIQKFLTLFFLFLYINNAKKGKRDRARFWLIASLEYFQSLLFQFFLVTNNNCKSNSTYFLNFCVYRNKRRARFKTKKNILKLITHICLIMFGTSISVYIHIYMCSKKLYIV